MTDKIKLSKIELIKDIRFFYLKQGLDCDIIKLSKKKLLEIVIDNDIPHISDIDIKNEIEETEKYNYLTDIIHYNYFKFKKISFEEINDFYKSPNLNSQALNNFIIKNNLIISNDDKEIKILIDDLTNAINNYCISTGHKNSIHYRTIPDITNFLNQLSSSDK